MLLTAPPPRLDDDGVSSPPSSDAVGTGRPLMASLDSCRDEAGRVCVSVAALGRCWRRLCCHRGRDGVSYSLSTVDVFASLRVEVTTTNKADLFPVAGPAGANTILPNRSGALLGIWPGGRERGASSGGGMFLVRGRRWAVNSTSSGRTTGARRRLRLGSPFQRRLRGAGVGEWRLHGGELDAERKTRTSEGRLSTSSQGPPAGWMALHSVDEQRP
jgi:hypothetical protein